MLDYYEVLQVKRDDNPEQIKRQYYKLAMLHHPDRQPSSMPPEERQSHEDAFKQVNQAYQVLSDPKLKAIYDERGLQGLEGSIQLSHIDPRALFKEMFGGDAFEDWIGDSSIADLLVELLREESERKEADKFITDGDMRSRHQIHSAPDTIAHTSSASSHLFTQTQMRELQMKREQRVAMLAARLIDRLSPFVDGSVTSKDFQLHCNAQASILVAQSMGPQLATRLGYVYSNKAKQFLGKYNTFLGIGAFVHRVKDTGHFVSGLVDLFREARKLNQVLAQVEEPDKVETVEGYVKVEQASGNQSVSIGLEDIMGLVMGVVGLEIESVIRDVCDLVLSENVHLTKAKALKRAEALRILGQALKEKSRQAPNSMPRVK